MLHNTYPRGIHNVFLLAPINSQCFPTAKFRFLHQNILNICGYGTYTLRITDSLTYLVVDFYTCYFLLLLIMNYYYLIITNV